MSENMNNERKAIELIKLREPEENFEKVPSLKGYDLKGKTKLVEVKYRKSRTSLSLQKTEYDAYKNNQNYWIYLVTGDLESPDTIKIEKFSRDDLLNKIPDEPHTVLYRFFPNRCPKK